jgi:adenine specific DNA methylase Mod
MNTYNENLKSAIYRIFDDQNFEEKFEVEFKKITESLHSKEETLWIAEEMARNGKVEEAMKIVNFFVQQFYGSCNNFIDVELSKLDLKIKNGDEVNYVATPKAVLPYVLSAVISTLDTKYYKRVLSIIDDIFSKENIVNNLGIVRRLSQNIILAFDSDSAGRRRRRWSWLWWWWGWRFCFW